ncbi:MAG TPA: hypothetical protein VJ725_26770 [Thermoanaerobaculia bacterium]|nr:hypothetical protein [Thermoanaerobaculia bacterium]
MRSPFLWLTLIFAFLACVPGGGRVTVRESRDVEVDYVQAAKIATKLAGSLRTIEASLARWESCLKRQSCTPEKFLSRTEEELLKALSAPELAGMRDWVREDFRSSAQTIEFYRSQTSSLSSTGEVARVFNREWSHGMRRDEASDAFPEPRETGRVLAMRPPLAAQGLVRPAVLAQFSWDKFFTEAVMPSVFAQVVRLVRRTRELAESNDLVAELCVQSNPGGAQFMLWPSSEPVRRTSGVSIGTLVIYRGLYAYDIAVAGNDFHCNPDAGDACSKIDLVNDGRPVFHCADVDSRDNAWEWQCSRREGPLDGCTARP